MSTLDGIQYSEDMTVSWKDVSFLTSQLECGKSAGPDGVCAEAIKFAHNKIAILLFLLLREFVYSFQSRLIISDNILLNGIFNSTTPLYSPIWAWWHTILTIKSCITQLYYGYAIIVLTDLFLINDFCTFIFYFVYVFNFCMCMYVYI